MVWFGAHRLSDFAYSLPPLSITLVHPVHPDSNGSFHTSQLHTCDRGTEESSEADCWVFAVEKRKAERSLIGLARWADEIGKAIRRSTSSVLHPAVSTRERVLRLE